MFNQFLLVGLGGFIGSVLRYAVYLLFRTHSFPLGTFLVNIAGSFIIGLIIGLSLIKGNFMNEQWRLFLATGICGGFTTFSAFSMENIHLLVEGKIIACLMYICGSVLFGLAAAWFGYKLAGN